LSPRTPGPAFFGLIGHLITTTSCFTGPTIPRSILFQINGYSVGFASLSDRGDPINPITPIWTPHLWSPGPRVLPSRAFRRAPSATPVCPIPLAHAGTHYSTTRATPTCSRFPYHRRFDRLTSPLRALQWQRWGINRDISAGIGEVEETRSRRRRRVQ
jgi:hypothetical protein